jgi:hypothetical protein
MPPADPHIAAVVFHDLFCQLPEPVHIRVLGVINVSIDI